MSEQKTGDVRTESEKDRADRKDGWKEAAGEKPGASDGGMTDQEVEETLRLLREATETIPQEIQRVEELPQDMEAMLRTGAGEAGDGRPGGESTRREEKGRTREEKSRKKVQNSLKSQLLRINIIPICVMLILLAIMASAALNMQIRRQVKQELSDTAVTLKELFGQLYEGDYTMVSVGEGQYAVCKGEHVLNEQDSLLLDALKEKTGMEYSFFYQDIRVLTTITGEDGVRYAASNVSAEIYDAVIGSGREAFYDNAAIGGKRYYAYYLPLFHADGSTAGMIGVAKTVQSMEDMRLRVLFPILLVAVLTVAVVVAVSIVFTGRIVEVLKKVELFLSKVSRGNLSAKLSPDILRRHDEFSDMGRSILSMQRSIRELVEKDALTTIYNRRYGDRQLQSIRRNAHAKGDRYAIAIGDIDFFKKINDTYGHECGDLVLKRVAAILKKYMAGRGFAARWGGEEFLLIQEYTDMESAEARLQEMLQEIRATEIDYGGFCIRVTMSIGLTRGVPEEELNVNLKRADACLYEAKQGGRDRLVLG